MNSTLSYASDTTLSLNEIEEQVDDFVTIQKGSVWKGCEFSKEIALFNSDNEITAYYIELVNDGKKCGYIIINAHNPYNIIEYSYQKDSFLNEAKKSVANEYNIAEHKQKIYYLGGINYAISGTNKDGNKKIVDVTTSTTYEISKKTLNSISQENDVEQYSKSSPPDSKGKGFITDPDKYEKKYDSAKTKNVTNWNLNYKTMDSFSSGGVCAPTAATNFMFYWYNRGTKYKKLLNRTWKKTFNSLYDYMDTSKSKGTKDNMLATGYKRYLSKKGFNHSVSFHKGTSYGKDLMKDIDKNRPCHLVVHGHYMYGNHSVLAVGYQQFIYKHWYGNNHETYIRIADGWTNKANRYVWGSCKGNWNYVSIQIK